MQPKLFVKRKNPPSMESEKGENVFEKFNWFPFEHQVAHARNIIDSFEVVNDNGQKLDLEQKSISPPPKDLSCVHLADKAEKLWEAGLAGEGGQKASLSRVLIRCLKWDYLDCILWGIFTRLIVILFLLESLRRLLDTIDELDHYMKSSGQESTSLVGVFSNDNQQTLSTVENNNTHKRVESIDTLNTELRNPEQVYQEILIYAIFVWFSVSVYFIATSVCKYKFYRCGIKSRIIMTQLIRKKSLKVHLCNTIKDSSNRALSLISNDVAFIENAHPWLFYNIFGPGALISASAWLALTQVGWQPVMILIPFLLVFVGVQIYLPELYKEISQKRKLETDKRLDIINTALNSMKIVKMYAWESLFKEKVETYRDSEIKQIKYLDRFSLFDLFALAASNRLLPAIVFLGAILIYGDLSKQVLFSTTVCFGFWRADMMFYFPKAIRSFSDTRIACENIKKYLLLDEFVDQRVREAGSGEITQISSRCLQVSLQIKEERNNIMTRKTEQPSPKVDSSCKDCTNTDRTLVIDGLDLDMESGDLVFVVGPVGSGKSSLLLTLLGETRIIGGQLTFTKGSRFAYASQEACLFPDTLRNNITNGRAFESDRYNKVLDVCSLRRDLEQLPDADQTRVGSKGVALSGGQKARLSLARAIYSRADIYLLDDPLSALDSKVAKEIFTNCISSFLADKLVVLATHQLQFLNSANKVAILGHDSRPIFGHWKELSKQEELRPILEEFKKFALDQEEGVSSNHLDDEKIVEPESAVAVAAAEAAVDINANFRSGASNLDDGMKEAPAYGLFISLGFKDWIELLVLILSSILSLASSFYSDYYIRIWSANIQANEIVDATDNLRESEHRKFMMQQLCAYMAVNFTASIATFWNFYILIIGSRRATKRMHEQMIKALFRAKMSFYDFCNPGELSSRYASDFGVIDYQVVYNLVIDVMIVFGLISNVIIMSLINPLQLLCYLILFLTLMLVAKRPYRNLRMLMQLSKALRAPMLTSLTSAIDDLKTIRSEPDHLRNSNRQFNLNQDRLSSISVLTHSYECSLSIMTKTIASIIGAANFYIIFVLYWNELEVSATGTYLLMALGSFTLLPSLLEYGSVLEGAMMSVNSVRKLIELEPEDKRNVEEEEEEEEDEKKRAASPEKRPLEWTSGQVNFQGVTMRYFEDEKPAIEGLTLTIRGGERIGVVGRTGAGKSTIVSVLYRLYPFEGSILIDGIDTKSLKLKELRASLGVIPQDPVLFSSSLRKNLDPSNKFTDQELWRALEVVNLKKIVLLNSPDGLEQQISEGGRNFSVGQRQLICLARAVLRYPKILLVDEATANVDTETDALIQQTIRAHFTSSTIITVAHRLNTVLDYDRIMVLDAGRVVEFDSVPRLLELENGIFRGLLQSASDVK